MRPDYCPAANEPCQSLCETPCLRRKPLTKDQIDLILAESFLAANGSVYSTRVYDLVRAIEVEHGIVTPKEPTP